MVSNFYEDLQKAHQAETIALQALSALYPCYCFYDVSDNPQYFHTGDILATDKESGEQFFFEVKDDCRIAQTRNVLLEDEVYYHDSCTVAEGNLHSDYQYYCVVSQNERKIYVLDFSVLRAHYRKGTYKVIPHAQQTTYCYLLPLADIEKMGGLLKVIEY